MIRISCRELHTLSFILVSAFLTSASPAAEGGDPGAVSARPPGVPHGGDDTPQLHGDGSQAPRRHHLED